MVHSADLGRGVIGVIDVTDVMVNIIPCFCTVSICLFRVLFFFFFLLYVIV